jgi:2-phospho-L-lactate guanylyltransferase
VKSKGTKSRLTKELTPSERKAFTVLMLRDLLDVLKKGKVIKDCFVVSSDEAVLSIARDLGAGTIREEKDLGVNAAVNQGIKDTESENIMVIPSDLPFLVQSDIRRLLSLKSSGLELVMAPSIGFDGTNALLFSRTRPVTLSYDSNSFWAHLGSAGSKGLSVGVYTGPGVMFDVDSSEDLLALARSRAKRRSVSFAKKVLR